MELDNTVYTNYLILDVDFKNIYTVYKLFTTLVKIGGKLVNADIIEYHLHSSKRAKFLVNLYVDLPEYTAEEFIRKTNVKLVRV